MVIIHLFSEKYYYAAYNCRLIPSALGNVYLLKSFALSFLNDASKNPDILSFLAKNGPEFFENAQKISLS